MMTFKSFQETHMGGYYLRAAEDIPGFAKKGWSLYGNCGDMIVVDFSFHPQRNLYIVYLANPV